jgi:hypothetical protein
VTAIEKLAYEYCQASPSDGQIVVRGGAKGIVFTGQDSPRGGEFIPLADLGYNKEIGFFRKSDFPGRKSA